MIFNELWLRLAVVVTALWSLPTLQTTSESFTDETVPPAYTRAQVGSKSFECFTNNGRSAKNAFEVISAKFEEYSNIFLIDASEKRRYQLTFSVPHPYDDILPSMSPDGCKIVFSRALLVNPTTGLRTQYSIWLMDIDGNWAHQLVSGNETDDVNARFVGYGHSVLFERKSTDGTTASRWIVNSDGSALRRVQP